MKLLIAIPTYNEIENIEPLIKLVFENVPSWSEILVIDDNSPDGTAAAVERLMGQYPDRLHLLKRPGKQGLAQAYLAAFEWGGGGMNAITIFSLKWTPTFHIIPRIFPKCLIK